MREPVAGSSPEESLLRRAEACLRRRRAADVEQLAVAYEWAVSHRRTIHVHTAAAAGERAQDKDVREIGAISLPVWEYAPAELAVVLELHPLACQRLMADAVDLRARLPHTWAAVRSLELEAWVARKIAAATRELDAEQAGWVDDQIVRSVRSLSAGRLLSLVQARVEAADSAAADARAAEAAQRRLVHLSRETEHGTRSIFARCDAVDATRFFETCDKLARFLAAHEDGQDRETLDQLRARAVGILADPQAALDVLAGHDPRRGKSVVYVHTTPEQLAAITDRTVARIEDIGPATRGMLRDFLGHDHITLRPVIDLADDPPADCYEIPAETAERLHLAMPADVFPYAPSLARRLDGDHTAEYDFGDEGRDPPPGQTRVTNLGKMARRHHRIKTHATDWHVEQLPGHRYLWTTPHGRCLLVDRQGTHPVTATHSAMEARLDMVRRDWVLAS